MEDMSDFTGELVRDAFKVHTYAVMKKKTFPRRPSNPVQTSQVHPLVWEQALKAANNDALRIEVLSEREVIVHNSRDWRNGSTR